MKVDVQTEIVIRRPLSQVAEFAADPDNVKAWYKNIHSIEWKTGRPLRIGTRIDFKARFLGRELAYTYEITGYIPGKSLTMRTAQGPFPMETTYCWEELEDGGTKMTLRNSGKPSGFSLLMAPFMSMAMRKANQKDLQLLKEILERAA